MTYKIHNGNSINELKQYPDNHFDSVVCDPPYGISFLGKDWDIDTGSVEIYKECLRVLKPGGHLLAFSAARTYHHLALSVEKAGFEIRDQIMWIYGSGFPKSQDVGKMIQKKDKNSLEAKQWEGWGTCLKPAHEPIVMARKPMKQTHAKNALEYGTGSLNIDACRVTGNRFPSNVIGEIDEPYQKYFYCPKTSRRERHAGFEKMPEPMFGNVKGCYDENGERFAVGFDARGKNETHNINVMGKTPYCNDCNKTINGTNDHSKCDPALKTFIEKRTPTVVGNNHPTVKPLSLMSYLIKLVTPPGGTVLDPFMGSGSTGCAAVSNGFNFVGIDLDKDYCAISETRINHYASMTDTQFNKLFEIEDEKRASSKVQSGVF